MIALIPARSGSKRIPNKNIKLLNGVPLIAYTIAAAKQSGVFRQIVCSTDSKEIGDIARSHGAEYLIRPPEFASDESPDIEWVHHALRVTGYGYAHKYFAILRVTSPFRTAKTIQRAWHELERSEFDCLRAVEAVSCSPYKMWTMNHCELSPLLPVADLPPWHSRPSQSLPRVYQQNASLEMAKTSLVLGRMYPSICAGRVWGFLNPAPEGFDLNTPDDWSFAEMKLAAGEWTLPLV